MKTASSAPRTLEQRLKFDHGLSVGRHLVRFTHGPQSRMVLVDISPRGIVRCLAKPDESDMYSSWCRVKGDVTESDGGVIVWGARDPECVRLFDGEPVATVAIKV